MPREHDVFSATTTQELASTECVLVREVHRSDTEGSGSAAGHHLEANGLVDLLRGELVKLGKLLASGAAR